MTTQETTQNYWGEPKGPGSAGVIVWLLGAWTVQMIAVAIAALLLLSA